MQQTVYLVEFDANLTVTAVNPVYTTELTSQAGKLAIIARQDPGIGSTYDPAMGAFSIPPRKRWVTKLAFDNRFTMAEASTLKSASIMPARNTDETDTAYATRSATAAQLQVLSSRLNMATYIDLTRSDTRNGVMMLEQAGLIAVGRALEILDGPITDTEYYFEA